MEVTVETRPDGCLILCIAVPRSGKTVYIKRVIEKHTRVLAFDPKGEYVAQLGFTACYNRAELLAALKKATGDARIALVHHDKKEFDFWCDCAFNWNRQKQATLIAEELGATTNAGKASGHWGRLLCQSLAYGPTIIATVQRGQEVDKTILNFATHVHVMRHQTESDRNYIASQLGVSVSEIPRDKLEFFHWTCDKGVVVRGNIDFAKGKATQNWPQGTPRFREKGGNRRVITPDLDGKFKQIQYT